MVNGYTDTSGIPRYNMDLSMGRANAVKAELILDSAPAAVIATKGSGEMHLLALVPPAPACVSRRTGVEISIQSLRPERRSPQDLAVSDILPTPRTTLRDGYRLWSHGVSTAGGNGAAATAAPESPPSTKLTKAEALMRGGG
jgi:hypothetical protein